MSVQTVYDLMGTPHFFDLALPQTARSEGADPALPWCDLESIHDLASLDLARQRHIRRKATDAVDYLIALLDALDADTEDMEEDDAGGDRLDEGELDNADSEPMLGAPENHPFMWFVDMDDTYHKSRGRRRLGDQTTWAAGTDDEVELCREAEPEAGYDLPEGDDERCGSEHDGREPEDCGEPYLSVVEWQGTGDNWFRSGQPTGAWGTDIEEVNEDGTDWPRSFDLDVLKRRKAEGAVYG